MSPTLAELGAATALGWATLVATVSAEAMRRAWVRARRARAARATALREDAPRGPAPEVLVVRPCAGDEPSLFENLRSLARAGRSFPLRCRLAVADASDPAWPVACRAAEALAAEGIDAAAVLTRARGPNRKVSQIHEVLRGEAGRFDVVLIADSDVDLGETSLDLLIEPLTGPHPHAAAWAPPVEHGLAEAPGDRASAALLGASLHAFPLLAGLDRRGLVGKLFAVRKNALDRIGGFGGLRDHLGEDMELGRRLTGRRLTLTAAPIIARSMASGRSMEQALSRFARWLMVIRAQRPALLPSYPLLFFATPLILALSLLTAPAAPLPALAGALLALASRAAVALFASRAAGRPLGLGAALRASLAGDWLLARAFARALGSRHVEWRGSSLVLGPGGLLREGEISRRAAP
ncbi:MAG: glycosyltransferase [Byssovorax sp.]